MIGLGLNVAADGRHDGAWITAAGADAVRIVLTFEHNIRKRLRDYQEHGIFVLGVYARESSAGFGADADALAYYARQYGDLLGAVQVGNESDLESPSSWTMSPEDLTRLGWTARAAMPDMTLVCAGMASGQPDWLADVGLGWCNVVACLVPDQRVTARAPASANMRKYEGDVIRIQTAGGNQVTCTPNHPILTRQGWLPARAVKEGFQVAYDSGADRAGTWGPNDVQVPTPISEVFRSLAHVGEVVTRRGLPLDFHGDGRDGDVHVVRTDRFLRGAFSQRRPDIVLQIPAPRGVALAGGSQQRLQSRALAWATESRALSLATCTQVVPMPLEQHVDAALLDAEARGNGPARFPGRVPLVQRRDMRLGVSAPTAPRAEREAPLLEFLREVGSVYPDVPSERLQRLPAGIAFVDVVEVRTSQFDGHVYNLSTADGIICSDGIVTHNCHPYAKDSTPDNDLPDAWELVEAYRRYGLPVWVTEWGWWSDDEARGEYEVRDMAQWARFGAEVERYFHFCSDDLMVAPFGLYRTDGSPKPAALAFAAIGRGDIEDIREDTRDGTATDAPWVGDGLQAELDRLGWSATSDEHDETLRLVRAGDDLVIWSAERGALAYRRS